MVEAAERGDFAAARAEHKRLMRLMLVNFVESNPIPVKSAMAMLGLLDEHYRLPMVAAERRQPLEHRRSARRARAGRASHSDRVRSGALGWGRAPCSYQFSGISLPFGDTGCDDVVACTRA